MKVTHFLAIAGTRIASMIDKGQIALAVESLSEDLANLSNPKDKAFYIGVVRNSTERGYEMKVPPEIEGALKAHE